MATRRAQDEPDQPEPDQPEPDQPEGEPKAWREQMADAGQLVDDHAEPEPEG